MGLSFDFDAAVRSPFRMQPGLRRLAPGSRQLTALDRDSRHLHEKIAALRAHPEVVLLQTPGFDAAPALAALARQAAREHPEAFGWDGSRAQAFVLGWQVLDGELGALPGANPPLAAAGDVLQRLAPPWRLAGLLSLALAEDFAVIDGRSAHIPWLAVALPSHWAPQDKVGRHFTEVHAPVADNRQLLTAADALARLVSADTCWERFVWSIGTSPLLNQHPSLPRPSWRAGEVAAQAHWRGERQTFIPLPEQRQAVFTILVDTQPLHTALATAHQARRVHDALASMSEAVLRYRNLHAARDELLAWLAHRAEP